MIDKIDEKSGDYSMPNRVRNTLKRLADELQKEDQDKAMRITTAVYSIEEIVNDINIPMHAKTALWDILSDLESVERG